MAEKKRVAINGLGRIGRAALKLLHGDPDLDLVAVNDIAPVENLAYLLRYDTAYGRFDGEITVADGNLVVEGHQIATFAERDPANLPWRDLNVDLVFECTGLFTEGDDLTKHVAAGAKYVVLSAPTKSTDVPTLVHGVNRPEENPQIISCASCTTNCIAPVMEVLARRVGVERAIMTTVHAYTASQALVDRPDKKDYRRGRNAAANLVPATTGAAIAATKALPGLSGKFDGLAVRAPIPVGSIADIVVVTSQPVTVEQVNDIFVEEAATQRYAGILGASTEPLVSADIIGDSRASIVDLALTKVVDGTLLKVMAWYDNEWGFTNQMIREAREVLVPGS